MKRMVISPPAAMVLAKQAGMKPPDLAIFCRHWLLDGVTAVDIAGPGFIVCGSRRRAGPAKLPRY